MLWNWQDVILVDKYIFHSHDTQKEIKTQEKKIYDEMIIDNENCRVQFRQLLIERNIEVQ